MYSGIHSRTPASPFFRITANIARRRPHVSLAAVSTAAAVGLLGAAGVAIGAAPWTQTIDDATRIVQGGPQPTSGQAGAALFAAIAGVTARGVRLEAEAGGQPDIIRSAVTAGRAASTPLVNPATQAAAQRQPAAAGFTPHTLRSALRQAAKRPAAVKQLVSQAHPVPVRPYLIYDSVIPSAIPRGQVAAVYANGAYAASSAQLAGHRSVLWIDTNGSDPAANVLDVEPGDATPYGAAQWARHRLTAHPGAVAIVYTMKSEWQQVKDNVATLPRWMQAKVRYWIADPTGTPHNLPGANATQWYWGHGYDITTATPSFAH